MSVWAFACKIESSQNRWFDGTDQFVNLDDSLSYDFGKNPEDQIDTLDVNRKSYEKYVSQLRRGVGSTLFNEILFNEKSSRLTDYSDAYFLLDSVEIDLSRQILRFVDSVGMFDFFSKTIEGNKSDSSVIGDSFFSEFNDSETGDTYNTVVDDSFIEDRLVSNIEKEIQSGADDSISLTETFSAAIGGKSFRDIISIKENFTKTFDNAIGDEGRANPIGVILFNEFMFNEESDSASIITSFGLIEEVQIILT